MAIETWLLWPCRPWQKPLLATNTTKKSTKLQQQHIVRGIKHLIAFSVFLSLLMSDKHPVACSFPHMLILGKKKKSTKVSTSLVPHVLYIWSVHQVLSHIFDPTAVGTRASKGNQGNLFSNISLSYVCRVMDDSMRLIRVYSNARTRISASLFY